jgi:uncharacterized protein with WD repeat
MSHAGDLAAKLVASFGESGEEAPGGFAFTPDGSFLVTVGSGTSNYAEINEINSAMIWNMKTRQVVRSFGGFQAFETAVAVSPDGLMSATPHDGSGSSPSNGTFIWNWSDLSQIASLLISGVSFGVNSVAFSPDSSLLVVGTGTATGSGPGNGAGQAVLWDVATQQRRAILSGQANIVNDAVFSPDGKSIATASGDGSVWLWDTASAQHVGTLTGHLSSVNSVTYSPDGTIIATGSFDTSVRLRDAATGTQLAELVGQNSEVHSVSFSADGKILVSAGLDNFVTLWDPVHYQVLGSIITGPVWYVAISPAGRSLVTLNDLSGAANSRQAISLWSF